MIASLATILINKSIPENQVDMLEASSYIYFIGYHTIRTFITLFKVEKNKDHIGGAKCSLRVQLQ